MVALCGSALKNKWVRLRADVRVPTQPIKRPVGPFVLPTRRGIQPLMDAIVDYLPSPDAVAPAAMPTARRRGALSASPSASAGAGGRRIDRARGRSAPAGDEGAEVERLEASDARPLRAMVFKVI